MSCGSPRQSTARATCPATHRARGAPTPARRHAFAKHPRPKAAQPPRGSVHLRRVGAATAVPSVSELRAARADLTADVRALRSEAEARSSAPRPAILEHSAEREREWAQRDAQPIRGLFGPRPDTCGLASAAYHVPTMRCVPAAVPRPILRPRQRLGKSPAGGVVVRGAAASGADREWAGVFADAYRSESARALC
jgi:hypothetical protein